MILCIKNESGHAFEKATAGSIGFDLRAVHQNPVTIEPGQRDRFDTGISIELPPGWGALVQPRSGLGSMGVIAMTGVIDRDYRGRISVVLINLGDQPYTVEPGERIAQLVPVMVPTIDAVCEMEELPSSKRGTNGFGSTGRSAFTDTASAAAHAIATGSATVVRDDGSTRVHISIPPACPAPDFLDKVETRSLLDPARGLDFDVGDIESPLSGVESKR